MPIWIYILIGLAVVGITAVVVVQKKVNDKVRRLLAEMKRDDAIAFSECMIQDGVLQCPGVALIADSTLIIRSVFDKKREIPLTNVFLRKERTAIGKYGWYPWLGKRVLYLDTPETTNLAIGVRDPEPWRRALEKTKTS